MKSYFYYFILALYGVRITVVNRTLYMNCSFFVMLIFPVLRHESLFVASVLFSLPILLMRTKQKHQNLKGRGCYRRHFDFNIIRTFRIKAFTNNKSSFKFHSCLKCEISITDLFLHILPSVISTAAWFRIAMSLRLVFY